MYGCIESLGIHLDVDKIVGALRDGTITKHGTSCLPNDAWEVARSMVEGGVCGTKAGDWCKDCPTLDEDYMRHEALKEGIEKSRQALEQAIKANDWGLVSISLQGLANLV